MGDGMWIHNVVLEDVGYIYMLVFAHIRHIFKHICISINAYIYILYVSFLISSTLLHYYLLWHGISKL